MVVFKNIEEFTSVSHKFICQLIFSCFSWASDNLFTGKLPEFLGTLTELKDLYAWNSLALQYFQNWRFHFIMVFNM